MRNDALKNVALNEKPGARFFQDAGDGIREGAAPIGLVLFRSERGLGFEEEGKALVSCWRAWEKRTASSPQLTLTFRFCFFAVSRSKGGKPLAASFILTRFSARMRSASSPAERVARTLSGEEKFIEFLFYPAVIGESIGKGWVEMRPDVVEGHPDFEFQTTAAFSAHVEVLFG